MSRLKGVLYVVAGLGAVIVVAAVAVFGASEARLRKHHAVTPRALIIPTDSASLARGEHLAQSVAACIGCHGDKLQGAPVVDNPALGRIVALNLTRGRGGVGGTLSDVDFVRAIRHGVAPDGRALKLMPSSDYMNLSDEDLGALIAYVKSLPAVDNELPGQRLGPVGRALLLAGKLPLLHAERIDHAKATRSAVPVATSAEYGGYIASIGCIGCHGPTLTGGKILDGDPSWPAAANLTRAGSTKDWSEADFRTLLREGKRPGGFAVNSAMPWATFKNLTDAEISALWLYLQSLPGTPALPATN